MTVDDGRLQALLALADEVERRGPSLVEEMVGTKHVLPSVARGDLDMAIRRLRSFDDVVPLLVGRHPVGTVALVLAGNALLSNPLGTIGSAYVAGNAVRVRFPCAAQTWSSTVGSLVRRHLTDISFADEPGPAFIERSATDPSVGVVMVFGDDRWAATYEGVMRATGTTFVFEGGGNCPVLVLAGSDVVRASEQVVRGAFYNAGQACTSPERAYVHMPLYQEFLDRVVALAEEHTVGAPDAAGTTVGPMASRGAAKRIAAQLADARRTGAKVCAGGGCWPGVLCDGTEVAWVQPTVLANVAATSAVMRDETFGPVLTVTPVNDAVEATRAASAYDYGLAATVFGGGQGELDRLARTHGRVFRNEIWIDHDRRQLHGPFGGRKRSGWMWATENGRFVRRDGPRWNALELSSPRPPARHSTARQEPTNA